MGYKTKEKNGKIVSSRPTYIKDRWKVDHLIMLKKTKRCIKFLFDLHSNQILIFEETWSDFNVLYRYVNTIASSWIVQDKHLDNST